METLTHLEVCNCILLGIVFTLGCKDLPEHNPPSEAKLSKVTHRGTTTDVKLLTQTTVLEEHLSELSRLKCSPSVRIVR